MGKTARFIVMTLLSLLIGSCCLWKTHFTEQELKWLEPYNEGDTIIFQTSNGDRDTSWIVQKVIYHANCNPIASHGTHKYHTGRIFYQNSTKNYKSGGKELLSIAKYTDRTELSIFYLGNIFLLNDIDTRFSYSQLTNAELLSDGNIYLFTGKHPLARSNDIKYLYWNKDYGIIKYITYDEVVWKRINLDFEVE